jgi:hypothetical protein
MLDRDEAHISSLSRSNPNRIALGNIYPLKYSAGYVVGDFLITTTKWTSNPFFK